MFKRLRRLWELWNKQLFHSYEPKPTVYKIGKKKFVYDLWGDAVNTAGRMESYGLPGAVHVSAATAELLKGRFDLQPRGEMEVKGKGIMQTFLWSPPG